MVKFYCMKEKKNVEVANPTKTKIGKRDAMKAVCPKCGTKLFKFGSA